ncbi:TPA: hypothetical protein I9738_004791 [Serratia marcescens]|uniref:hypothetical protein n=1 Tax=Serratia sp. CY29653 TaxID=3383594 RepID=UPI001A3283DA|nr:hypothetical protein [Serratia marcescens]HAT4974251.1 hypothetical protein [Serratia marcescens]HAT4990966.1 hypothetical protein [Serratia marcescens]HAT5049331.1 hypothetical protein [Serratia marcescens]HEJ7081511.1 hypothetical protein [Serratia marcescens]
MEQKSSSIAPGYCIAQQTGPLAFHANYLFGGKPSEAARFFMQLNADTPLVQPGQMLIVADPRNHNQSTQIAALMQAKSRTSKAVKAGDSDFSTFLHRNYAAIAAFTSYGETVVGLASDAGERYFSQIKNILVEIEKTYQNQFRTSGALIGTQFQVERARLFGTLKPLLNRLTRAQLNMKEYAQIKHALGLSSKSLVHEWSTAGVGAIKGYSNYVDSASRAAKFMKAGGWIGIGLSGLNTTNDVYNACTTGREQECAKIAVKGYSHFASSTAAGIWVGNAGAGLAIAACSIVLGAATAGTGVIVCGIAGAAIGGAAGSTLGGMGSDYLTTLVVGE